MTPKSLCGYGLSVLAEPDPLTKAALTAEAARAFAAGELALGAARPPDRPARPEAPLLLPARAMPKRPVASLEGRIALIHALAHIELNAIDLAWDMLCRFSGAGSDLPQEFAADWLGVAADEAKHFRLLAKRLRSLGAFYGALPAHDGLWAAAAKTAHDVLARLAVVPLVLEARGLDVTPGMIARLRAAGDGRSARILALIAREEVAHVRAGWVWFEAIAKTRGLAPGVAFTALVREYHPIGLKPPFNIQARSAAGLMPEIYLS